MSVTMQKPTKQQHIPPCEGGKCQRRLNLWSNASRLPRHLLLKLMGMIQCTDQASHFSLNYQACNMSQTNFIDQISAFPSFSDFNVTALKWTDLVQDVVYQITSTRTVNTRHGQSVILSLQKADGSSCSAWACGMQSKELLQNKSNDNGKLTTVCTGYWKENKQGFI